MFKILVPIDNSEPSKSAIKHVVERFEMGEPLEVHLFHVQQPLNRQGHLPGGSTAFAAERSARILDSAGELLARAGLSYSAHICSGDAAEQIVRYAESNKFNSIIMASDGLGSLSEMIAGSVTAKVIRTSRVPVEIVPASPRSRLRAYAGRAGLGAGIAALAYAIIE